MLALLGLLPPPVARHEIGGRGLKHPRQVRRQEQQAVARHEIGGRGLKHPRVRAGHQRRSVARHEIGGRGLKHPRPPAARLSSRRRPP